MRAVQAGADLVLLPPDPEVAVQSLRARGQGGPAHGGRASTPPSGASSRPRSGSACSGAAWSIRTRPFASVARPEDVARALEIARRVDHGRAQRGRRCCRSAPRSRSGCSTSSSRATPAIRSSRASPRRSSQARRIPARDREPRARGLRGDGRPPSSRRPRLRPTCWRPASCGWPGAKGTADMSASHARLLQALARGGAAADRGVVRQPVPAAAVSRRRPSTCARTARRSRASGPRWRPLRRVCCRRQAAGDAAGALPLRPWPRAAEARHDPARGAARGGRASAPRGLAEVDRVIERGGGEQGLPGRRARDRQGRRARPPARLRPALLRRGRGRGARPTRSTTSPA